MNEVSKVKKEIIGADIDGFIARRQEFIEKVNTICVEKKDYHIIQGKKSLAKGGAEKIASIFNWQAKFVKDEEALQMLGDTKGLVAFKCTLTNNEKFVGEGRGAATLEKNNGDPNKTLKMAQKSAYIDGVIRASGLSDFFTQDLGPDDEGSTYNHLNDKVSDKQLKFIASLSKEKGYTEEDIKKWGFKKLTGGKEGSASQLIEKLIHSPKKEKVDEIQVEPEDIEESVGDPNPNKTDL